MSWMGIWWFLLILKVLTSHSEPHHDLDFLNNVLSQVHSLEAEVRSNSEDSVILVTEHKEGNKLALRIHSQRGNTTCFFDSTSHIGHVIHGVDCQRSGSLPLECICQSSGCTPYIPTMAIMDYLGEHKEHTEVNESVVGPADVLHMKNDFNGTSIEAVFLGNANHSSFILQFIRVATQGEKFGLPSGELKLEYRILGWDTEEDEDADAFRPPPGVYCPPINSSLRPMPSLSDQFSLDAEAESHLISYETLHVDSVEKLLSYTYRPHLHYASDFLYHLNLFLPNQKGSEAFRIVHDFKSGIQYRINQASGNCSIEPIPAVATDAVPLSNHHSHIKHANDLLFMPLGNDYVYSGTRRVRGVLCDVWIGKRPVNRDFHSTVEIIFSHRNWTIEVEVLNQERQIPMAVITYATKNRSEDRFPKVARTYFYSYSVGHSKWEHFEIASCLKRNNRLFLGLTLQVSYDYLLQHNLDSIHDSIRREIAGLAAVSPLRITDLSLSSGVKPEELEVYFVLLERANLTSGSLNDGKMPVSMSDAYMFLSNSTGKDIPVHLRLKLYPDKIQVVTVKEKSLHRLSESFHPNGRRQKIQLAHAGYTAGSMAGLGFSMAILGVGLGMFIGFLMWKKNQSSLSYLIAD